MQTNQILKTSDKRSLFADVDWARLDYRKELKNNITTVDELKRYLPLSSKEEADLRKVIEIHPMNIPRYYLSLIDIENPDDPVRKLCIPDAQELVVAGSMGETTKDPYGDDKHDKGNGVLHKYDYTALVVTSEYCAMYCRHCFRKRMVGLPNDLTVKNFEKAAALYCRAPGNHQCDYVRRRPAHASNQSAEKDAERPQRHRPS